jgi:hypothetical protein
MQIGTVAQPGADYSSLGKADGNRVECAAINSPLQETDQDMRRTT